MPFNLGTAVYNFQVSGLPKGTIQLNQFHSGLQKIQRGNFLNPLSTGFTNFNGILSMTLSHLGGALGLLSRLGGALGVVGLFSGLGGTLGVGGMISLAAEQEQVLKGMEVMLGDANKAKKLFAELKDFGIKTPLELPGILKASQSLLAGNVAAEDLVKTLRMIGDVAFPLRGAAGVEHLARVYATFRTQGQITNQDVNQFAFMNIPIREALAKVTGKTTAEIRKLVTAGRIGFPEMHNALVSLTSAGGRFHNQMEQSAMTLLGRWSSFVDIMKTDVFTKIGQRIIDVFKIAEVQERAIKFAQGFASTFAPTIDRVLGKIHQVFTDTLPLLRLIGIIGMEFLKVGVVVLRVVTPIIQAIGRWVGKHEDLVGALVKVVTQWTLVSKGADLSSAFGVDTAIKSIVALRTALFGLSDAQLAVRNSALAGGATKGAAAAGPIGMATSIGGGAAVGAVSGVGAIAALAAKLAHIVYNIRKSHGELKTAIPGKSQIKSANESNGHSAKETQDKEPNKYPSMLPMTPISTKNRPGSDMASFIGISQLAEKMQVDALNAAHDKLLEDTAVKTATATETLAGAVDGSRLRVTLDGPSSPPPTYGKI